VEIVEVQGLDQSLPACPYQVLELYRFAPEGLVERRIQGRFEVTGRPKFIERLRTFNPEAVPEFWR